MIPQGGHAPFRDGGFYRQSRNARPRRSGQAFASGHVVPYPPDYRVAFAFSALLCPLFIGVSHERLTWSADTRNRSYALSVVSVVGFRVSAKQENVGFTEFHVYDNDRGGLCQFAEGLSCQRIPIK